MTHPMHDDEEDAIERAMYQRLGREHGLTHTACPKCLHHDLRRVAPQLQLPLSFGYQLGPHFFHWLKDKMDAYAKGAPQVRLPWKDAELCLQQSGHDPAHLPHIPPAARAHPIYLMHVTIPSVGIVPVIADGQHRATLAVRARHDLTAILLSARIEPRCRTTEADERHQLELGQENGLLVWEIPVQYAVLRQRQRVVFGRIVGLTGQGPRDTGFFQGATNAASLALGAAALAPAEGPTLLRGPIAVYDALARRARFTPHLRVEGRTAAVQPLLRSQVDPRPRLEW